MKRTEIALGRLLALMLSSFIAGWALRGLNFVTITDIRYSRARSTKSLSEKSVMHVEKSQ